MKELDLPEFSADAAPEFIDAASAKAWLENVPLANVAVTPLPEVSLSQRTLRELLPVMTQGFSRSLARLPIVLARPG